MATDLRGFRYPLEPLRQRRQWQLDAALAQLAAAHQALAASEARRDALEREAGEQSARAAQAWLARTDPVAHTRALGYLVQLQQRKAQAERQAAQLREQLVAAQQRVQRCRQHVEALQRHRKEELAMYRIEKDRKGAAEADQDWSARSVPAKEGWA